MVLHNELRSGSDGGDDEPPVVGCRDDGDAGIPDGKGSDNGPTTLARVRTLQTTEDSAESERIARLEDCTRRGMQELAEVKRLLCETREQSARDRARYTGRRDESGTEDGSGGSDSDGGGRSDDSRTGGRASNGIREIPQRTRSTQNGNSQGSPDGTDGDIACRGNGSGEDEIRDGQLPRGVRSIRYQKPVVRRVRWPTSGPIRRVWTRNDVLQPREAAYRQIPMQSASQGRFPRVGGKPDFPYKQRFNAELVARNRGTTSRSVGKTYQNFPPTARTGSAKRVYAGARLPYDYYGAKKWSTATSRRNRIESTTSRRSKIPAVSGIRPGPLASFITRNVV